MANFPFQNWIHPKVKNLIPYLPGRSIKEIQNEYQIQDVIKLASNENPLGCSPKVLENIHHTPIDNIFIYPATSQHPLIEKLTCKLNIAKENLLIANGSDAIFSLLIQAYALAFQKKILTHQFAFMGYEIQALGYGIETLKASVHSQTWQVNINELIELSKKNVALLFLANPNNPTGQKIPWEEICKILDDIPEEVIFVLDEAYFEYDNDTHPDITSLIEKYPNLLITRTFSKGYGLAALRVGYAIGQESIINTLKRIQLPFSINQLGLNAAEIALSDQAFIEKTQKINQEGMEFLQKELQKFPLKTRPSYGNFVTIELQQDVKKLVVFLESQGVIVRGLHSFGLANVARITVGVAQQNQRFIDALQNYFKHQEY